MSTYCTSFRQAPASRIGCSCHPPGHRAQYMRTPGWALAAVMPALAHLYKMNWQPTKRLSGYVQDLIDVSLQLASTLST